MAWQDYGFLITATLAERSPLLDVINDPLQTLIQSFSAESTARLDLPLVLFHRLKIELFGDLGGAHAAFDVLLVGKDEDVGLVQLFVPQHLVELLLGNG